MSSCTGKGAGRIRLKRIGGLVIILGTMRIPDPPKRAPGDKKLIEPDDRGRIQHQQRANGRSNATDYGNSEAQADERERKHKQLNTREDCIEMRTSGKQQGGEKRGDE